MLNFMSQESIVVSRHSLNSRSPQQDKLTLDDLSVKYIGSLGKYQIQRIVILTVCFFFEGLIFGLPVYTAPSIGIRCKDTVLLPLASNSSFFTNGTTDVPFSTDQDACFLPSLPTGVNVTDGNEKRHPCRNFEFDHQLFEYTATEQFMMVCSNKNRRALSTGLYFAGMVMGLPFAGILSDRFGRKRLSTTFLFGQIALTCSAGFITNYYVYLGSRLVQGIVQCFLGTIMFSMGLELVGPSFRPMMAAILNIGIGGMYLIVSPLALAIKDWRYLQLAAASPFLIIALLYGLFVTESVRFLLAAGRTAEAWKILQHAAKVNGRELPDSLCDSIVDDSGHARISAVDVMKSSTLRNRAIYVSFLWFVNCTIYFGIIYGVEQLGGNILVTACIAGVTDTVIAFCCAPLWKFWGRRRTFSSAFLIAGILWIACSAPIIWKEQMGKMMAERLLVALGMMVKAAASACMITAFLYTPELFPTRARSSIVGVSNMIGRCGGILASVLVDLPKFVPGTVGKILPSIIFGILAFLGGFVALCLPETEGVVLPQTIEEGEAMTNTGNETKKKQTPKQKTMEEETFLQS